jgi:hypothetical protein
MTGRAEHTLHDTAESIEDSLRREVFRGNEIYEVFLAVLLLLWECGQLQSLSVFRTKLRTLSMI